jgi:hypothetical protein
MLQIGKLIGFLGIGALLTSALNGQVQSKGKDGEDKMKLIVKVCLPSEDVKEPGFRLIWSGPELYDSLSHPITDELLKGLITSKTMHGSQVFHLHVRSPKGTVIELSGLLKKMDAYARENVEKKPVIVYLFLPKDK